MISNQHEEELEVEFEEETMIAHWKVAEDEDIARRWAAQRQQQM